ncbi:hypothetical protein VP01_300g3 [Puccinia sorghi]|uniref:Uncharacterized protein n=1 Tax=Puccinia sorghi TaxID=27349 RepID=A0A0L6V0D0_9BASI|nr:hypothetical protein VP01_300g3 [Puccinia sorghi]
MGLASVNQELSRYRKRCIPLHCPWTLAAPFLPTSHPFPVPPPEQEIMLSTSEERPKADRQPVLIIQNSVRWCLCTLELPRLLAQLAHLAQAINPASVADQLQAQFRAAVGLLSEMESLVNQIAFSAGSATSDTPGGADKQEEMMLHQGVQVVLRCKSVLIQLSRREGEARDPEGPYRATQVDSPRAEPPFTGEETSAMALLATSN